MTVLALTTGETVLSIVGLAIGLVVAVVVVGLFNRVVRPASEIKDYAEDIQEAIAAISRNLEGAKELGRTHALATAVPGLAAAYLRKLGAAP